MEIVPARPLGVTSPTVSLTTLAHTDAKTPPLKLY